MGYKVIAPLVVIAPSEATAGDESGNAGPRYFYEGAIISDGYNDERCQVLADEGMLEKVDSTSADSGSNPDTVKAILADVGDDKDKAAAALEAEQAKDEPRSTLVEKLQAIVEA